MTHKELMDKSNEVLKQGREAIARLDKIIGGRCDRTRDKRTQEKRWIDTATTS